MTGRPGLGGKQRGWIALVAFREEGGWVMLLRLGGRRVRSRLTCWIGEGWSGLGSSEAGGRAAADSRIVRKEKKRLVGNM